MCTIGGAVRDGRTFLLKNFDYPPVPTGWAHFSSFNGGKAHFALVDHEQKGVNSGLNENGLGLQISRSKSQESQSPETEELRTVLNGEILTRFSTVDSSLEYIETFVANHPEMYGGNVMLADGGHISVTEYFGGISKTQIIDDGCLARANHSIFGIIENSKPNSLERYEKMDQFLQGLYTEMQSMDNDQVVRRCKKILQEPPIFRESTRSSFVICIDERRIDFRVGSTRWDLFQFT